MTTKKHPLPSEFLESRPELVAERISQLKLALSCIPVIGPAINELFIDLPNRIQQSRINDTVDLLKEKFDGLENKYLSQDYLKSEDFFDFTRNLFEEAQKIGSKEKRRALASVYVESIETNANYENSNNRLFMNFVSEISATQILILKFIEENLDRLNQISEYEKFYNLFVDFLGKKDLSQYKFKHYCNSLEIKSLISLEAGLEDFNSKSSTIAWDDHVPASVIITDFGLDFLKLKR